MEGRFNQDYILLTVIIIILVFGISTLRYFNPAIGITILIIWAISLVVYSRNNSSFKANNEVIKFRILYFIRYSINIADIRSIHIYPYEIRTRYGTNYRVMLIIDTENKTYKFNNVLKVSSAINIMFLENTENPRPDNALTDLYYYIIDIRKELKSENKITKFIDGNDKIFSDKRKY